MQITSVGEGKIMPSDGSAKFKCAYTAVVMKPFKGEVVDGKVTIVNKVSFAHVGSQPHSTDLRWASSLWSVRCKSSSRPM